MSNAIGKGNSVSSLHSGIACSEDAAKAYGRFLVNYTDTGRNLVNILEAGTLFSKTHSVLDRIKVYILGD